MKHLGLLVIAALLATPAQAGDDLATAAKKAKAKRKTSTTHVITNADVKKSKGKVVQRAGDAPHLTSKPAPTLTEKAEAERIARVAYEERSRVLKARIAELETKLAAIEQSYYDENDLTRRDTVIARQFYETKEMLDTARADLEALEATVATEPVMIPEQ